MEADNFHHASVTATDKTAFVEDSPHQLKLVLSDGGMDENYFDVHSTTLSSVAAAEHKQSLEYLFKDHPQAFVESGPPCCPCERPMVVLSHPELHIDERYQSHI